MVWIIIAAVALIMFMIDWFIVMGPHPKDWKGGRKNDRNSGPGR